VSQENVEIVRRAIDAFNSGDLAGALRDAATDIEVDWSRSRGLEAGVYVGYDAVRHFWMGFLETFERVTITADEFIPLGDDVVVPNTGRARGRDGIEVAAESVAVATVRGGHLVCWRMYQDRAEALKAVGLEG
jgi:ketosteroid isomerase-like protein